ncbi:MAG: hypothetical protein AAF415_02070 [Pseudomonadota bacterium]
MTKSQDYGKSVMSSGVEPAQGRMLIDTNAENALTIRSDDKRNILADPRGDLTHGIVECPASGLTF